MEVKELFDIDYSGSENELSTPTELRDGILSKIKEINGVKDVSIPEFKDTETIQCEITYDIELTSRDRIAIQVEEEYEVFDNVIFA